MTVALTITVLTPGYSGLVQTILRVIVSNAINCLSASDITVAEYTTPQA
jgi:hypothetical protein